MIFLILAPFLHIFLDSSFKNGIFPNNCKIATVLPIHKKVMWTILIIIDLFLSSLVFLKLLKNSYIKDWVATSTKKYFRSSTDLKNISTTHTLLDIGMAFYDNIHNNDYSGIILLDLKKYFDSFSHDMILKN